MREEKRINKREKKEKRRARRRKREGKERRQTTDCPLTIAMWFFIQLRRYSFQCCLQRAFKGRFTHKSLGCSKSVAVAGR